MEIEFFGTDVESGSAESVIVVLIFEGPSLSVGAADVDHGAGGCVSRAIRNGRFVGAEEQTIELAGWPELGADRLAIIGAGIEARFDVLAAERVAARGCAAAAKAGVRGLELRLSGMTAELVAHAALGAALAAYEFRTYRTGERPGEARPPRRLQISCDAPDEARAAFRRLEGLLAGIALARDLVNEPPNILHPAAFAVRIEALTAYGIEVNILGEGRMTELGMGALLSVGRGSRRESQLVTLEWNGVPDTPTERIAFVGKGVTFDSGGLSIKAAKDMERMKDDMGGAAAVVGTMLALARRNAKANVVAVLGLVENMPDGDALRPSDIVTSMSGQTIEIVNTDAEGRLVLADALWYAHITYKPKIIIDLATLTGAITLALGDDYAGFFANDDALADRLADAGREAGEQIWRLPLVPAYDKLHDSPIADMKNVGGHPEAMGITAALFLQRFVRDCAWAHFDISSVAWRNRSDMPTVPVGASGYGVRLLDRFVAGIERAQFA